MLVQEACFPPRTVNIEENMSKACRKKKERGAQMYLSERTEMHVQIHTHLGQESTKA